MSSSRYWSRLATCAALSTLKNCPDKTENLAGFDVLMTNVGGEGQPSPDCHRHHDEDRVATTGKLQSLLTDWWNSQTKNTNWFLLSPSRAPPVMNLAEKIILRSQTWEREREGFWFVAAMWQPACQNFYPENILNLQSRRGSPWNDIPQTVAVMNEKNIKIMAETLTLI